MRHKHVRHLSQNVLRQMSDLGEYPVRNKTNNLFLTIANGNSSLTQWYLYPENVLQTAPDYTYALIEFRWSNPTLYKLPIQNHNCTNLWAFESFQTRSDGKIFQVTRLKARPIVLTEGWGQNTEFHYPLLFFFLKLLFSQNYLFDLLTVRSVASLFQNNVPWPLAIQEDYWQNSWSIQHQLKRVQQNNVKATDSP